MEYFKTQALTIRCFDYKESSQIVTFYTDKYGKVSILARGAKRTRYDWEGPFDLLNHCQIVYISNPSKQMNTLTNNKIYDNFSPLHYNYSKLKYGLAVAEFLGEITAFEDRNPKLFRLALLTLKSICKEDKSLNLILFRFQVHALKLLGFLSSKTLKASYFPKGIISKNDAKEIFAIVRNLLVAKTPLASLKITSKTARKLYNFLNKYIEYISGNKLRIILDANKQTISTLTSRASAI